MDRSYTAASGCEATLQECLTCYLCGDVYRRPRILPCGHTFCSECLAKIKDEIIGQNRYQRHDTPGGSTAECKDENSIDSCRTSDSGFTQKSYLYGSTVDSCRSTDDSSNVDCYTHPDADPNCYRPHNSVKIQARRPDAHTDHSTPNGMSRSRTFTRDKSQVPADRSPSRFSAPPGCVYSDKACSQCGHVSPSTLPRRAKNLHQKSSLREQSPKSGPRWDSSPQRASASHLVAPSCSFEQKHGREMEPFFCPLPECNYSLRVMNLSRWSPRNKTVADIVSVWRRHQENLKDASTQTSISNNQSLLVTIPRSLVDTRAVTTFGQRRRHSSMVDMAIDSAISMDGLERGYLPRGHNTWRSYAAMVGMNILHQLVNL